MREQNLYSYASNQAARRNQKILSGTIFAKVLTDNDDAGKHGVLIPMEGYDFFPELHITDPSLNCSLEFPAFDSLEAQNITLAYKYYQRYPERRVTRLHRRFNERDRGERIAIFLRLIHQDETAGYYVDFIDELESSRYQIMVPLIFGHSVIRKPGTFLIRAIESLQFESDTVLDELLSLFDGIKRRGWIASMRKGDTGIGYTFESLIGVKENNDKAADFKGIEIKCKQINDSQRAGGKINLFQQAPTWVFPMGALERLKILGQQNDAGRYTCYSQVTVNANNLGLKLQVQEEMKRIDLVKQICQFGFWDYAKLEERLREKHSRAVFVKAIVKRDGADQRLYKYDELVYCESPSVLRLVDLIKKRNVVFEFTMSEKDDGCVRNHGYPWRLTNELFLSDLFGLQIKLR